MMISVVDRVRLESLLGMLGSKHIGERENAVRLVEQFRQQRGLTWSDLLTPIPASARLSAAPKQPPPASTVVRSHEAGDAIWRWSMLAGLAAVGAMSFYSIIERNGAAPVAATDDKLRLTANYPAAEATPGPTVASARKPTAVDTHDAASAFSQGQTDRNMWETWRTSGPAVICSAHFSPAQDELRSACATARKLLAEFDRRRRTDPEYRRGWNSAS